MTKASERRLPHPHKTVASGVAALLAASVISCKQTESTSVKTLDAIASGGITKLYQCKGTNSVRITSDKIRFDRNSTASSLAPAQKQSLQNAVSDYFSAIDPGMQELFLQLGGQVLITSEAKIGDYCRSARDRNANGGSTQDNIHGCFVFVDDPNGQQKSIFTIVHSDSAQNIRYFGPQIFGYLYAQFYSRLAKKTQDSAKFRIAENESMEFRTYKDQIADAFLSDMLASTRYSLDNLKPILGSNAEAELRAHGRQDGLLNALSMRRDGEAATPASGELASRRSQVRDYFFAHAFQSMNCNEESFAITKENFPRSLQAYQLVNAALLKISEGLNKTASQNGSDISNSSFLRTESNSSEDGLGLTGDIQAKNFDLAGILQMVMPLLSQLGGGGSGGIDIGGLLTQLLGALPTNSTASSGMLSTASLAVAGVDGLFNAVQSSGCPGGNCGVASANGGCLCGGNCSGNGCSGSCGCANCVTS